MRVSVPDRIHGAEAMDRLLANVFRSGWFDLLDAAPDGPFHDVAFLGDGGVFVVVTASLVTTGTYKLKADQSVKVNVPLRLADLFDGVLYFTESASSGMDPLVKVRSDDVLRLEEVAE